MTSDRSPSSTASRASTEDRPASPLSSHPTPARSLLWRLYISHTLSTWNARTFEFFAVIALATIFPATLFYASCYALFRSAAAAVLGSWIGNLVDKENRLFVVRQSIVWQRLSVAVSCLILMAMLSSREKGILSYALFTISVVLAGIEKLAFIANTVAVERDWIIVVSDSLKVDRQDLNSAMRRIDLVCKLIAPVGIGLLDSYSTTIAIWFVFAQNAISVTVEYFAIAHVYTAIPELAKPTSQGPLASPPTSPYSTMASPTTRPPTWLDTFKTTLHPWQSYAQNPAFLASFSLSLLYLTVLSFASQMTTYLLTLGFTSTHVSLMRLASVLLELSATCAAPFLMSRIGAVRSGLWFINEQLLSIALALGLFLYYLERPLLAGAALVCGVALSRLGLWGFDLCVQFLVQQDTPESSRGAFSAVEMALQNAFELVSFAITIVFYRPEDFKVPVFVSAAAIAASAACFAGFVRKKRGHLVHADRCLKRVGKAKVLGYRVLPTIEEEEESECDGNESGRGVRS